MALATLLVSTLLAADGLSAAADPEPRIIGGTTVPDGKYPFMAALEMTGSQFCGGSVIAPTWVMTAAHCVTNGAGVEDILPGDVDVVIGRYDLTTMDGEIIVGSDILVHPMWDGDGDGDFEYDVALIELSSPTAVAPMELATSGDIGLYDPGDDTTVMGWGWTNPSAGPGSTTLQEVDVPVVADSFCEAAYGPFFSPSIQLCAGDDNVDSCVGDSGGPLVGPPGTSGWTQVGIVSAGPVPCAQAALPGIYAEVAAFEDFITDTAFRPIADSFAQTLTEDLPITFALSGSDPNGDPLTFSVDTGPANGSLSVITQLSPTTAQITYTPDPDYSGLDSFTYLANDSVLDSVPATVDITVDPVNDLPNAMNDGPFTVAKGGTLNVNGVLDNDSDADGDPLTAVKLTDPANGALTLNPDGSFTYVHDGTETTSDSFTYAANDGTGNSDPASVFFTITPVNAVPVGVPDAYTVAEGATLNVNGVLDNDSDADGDPLTALKLTDPANGALTLNPDGSFTYVHDGSETTSDSFTYAASDGAAQSDPTAVMITVDPVIDPQFPGLVDPDQGLWYLQQPDGTFTSFYFGNPGDFPIVGDWDCNGTETPGMYRQSDGYVYLRNSNTVGIADIRFFFGNPGDTPVAGDFNANGCDTVSIYRGSEGRFYIINKLGTDGGGLGAADVDYLFGDIGDKPFVGDFDDDGVETAGLHRESTGLVYFRNTHTQGIADSEFIFGDPADRLIAGDWTSDGTHTVGVFRPSVTTLFLKESNSAGVAEREIVFGESNWLPVAGAFWP